MLLATSRSRYPAEHEGKPSPALKPGQHLPRLSITMRMLPGLGRVWRLGPIRPSNSVRCLGLLDDHHKQTSDRRALGATSDDLAFRDQ
jgi:hypothetical protein